MESEITQDVQKSTETALTIIDVVKSISIKDRDDYEFAQLAMKDVKDRIKQLEEIRFGQTRPIDEAKKRIMEFFKVPLQKLEDAKSFLNKIMVRWAEDQERIRKEEEKRLQEEAKKRAEEDALKAALEAEKAGDTAEAEAIISEPVYVPPIKVVSEVPKSKESHIRETWSAEGYDLMTTVKAISDGKAPLQCVKYDDVFINGQGRSYKQALSIPGVRAISKKTQI
jgi:hypothetical protein